MVTALKHTQEESNETMHVTQAKLRASGSRRNVRLNSTAWSQQTLEFTRMCTGVPRSRTNYHKYYVFPHTTKEWNSLPKEIATVPGRVWIRLEDCYLRNGRLAYHYHYHYHFLLICFTEPLQESSVVKDSLLFSVTRSKEPLQR